MVNCLKIEQYEDLTTSSLVVGLFFEVYNLLMTLTPLSLLTPTSSFPSPFVSLLVPLSHFLSLTSYMPGQPQSFQCLLPSYKTGRDRDREQCRCWGAEWAGPSARYAGCGMKEGAKLW